MASSSKRILCIRCFIILYSLRTVIEGKSSRVMKPLATLTEVETSSRAWNRFHASSDSSPTSHRLTTSPADDGSPRQPGGDGKNTPDAAGSGGVRSIRRTRQVDPLHSCIEAKCSSWRSTDYLNCIYHHCINGLESSGASRFGRDIAGKTYPTTREGFPRDRRFLPGMKLLQRGAEEDGALVPVVASVPAGAFLSMNAVQAMGRGFNGISDVCKESNCGPYQETVQYFNCIESVVDCPSLSR